MIDAGLGRKTEAITEGKRACQLLPISKDAADGPVYVTNLALIYAWVGEKDLALEQLAISAKIPAGVTYGELNSRQSGTRCATTDASRKSSPRSRRKNGKLNHAVLRKGATLDIR